MHTVGFQSVCVSELDVWEETLQQQMTGSMSDVHQGI